MSYITDLRKHVGNAPLIVPGVCIVLKDEKGRVLLQKRSDSGKWGTIGGAMEPVINDDESLDLAFFSFSEAEKILNPFSLLILRKTGYYD